MRFFNKEVRDRIMTSTLRNLEMKGTFLMFRPLSIVIMWAQVAAYLLSSSIYRRQVYVLNAQVLVFSVSSGISTRRAVLPQLLEFVPEDLELARNT